MSPVLKPQFSAGVYLKWIWNIFPSLQDLIYFVPVRLLNARVPTYECNTKRHVLTTNERTSPYVPLPSPHRSTKLHPHLGKDRPWTAITSTLLFIVNTQWNRLFLKTTIYLPCRLLTLHLQTHHDTLTHRIHDLRCIEDLIGDSLTPTRQANEFPTRLNATTGLPKAVTIRETSIVAPVWRDLNRFVILIPLR